MVVVMVEAWGRGRVSEVSYSDRAQGAIPGRHASRWTQGKIKCALPPPLRKQTYQLLAPCFPRMLNVACPPPRAKKRSLERYIGLLH